MCNAVKQGEAENVPEKDHQHMSHMVLKERKNYLWIVSLARDNRWLELIQVPRMIEGNRKKSLLLHHTQTASPSCCLKQKPTFILRK